MKRMIRIFLITLLLSTSAFAQEVREFYNGVRALGMGGATLAVVNDETALISNPAGLGKIRDIYGTLLDPEIEIGSGYSGINQTKAISDPFSIGGVGESLLQSPDRYYHARAQVFPSFVVRNFGLGILHKKTLDGMYDSASNSLAINSRDDLAVVLGINLRLWGGRIKIGANAKLISRIELDETKLNTNPITNLDNSYLVDNSLLKEGVGLSTDAGILLAAPWTYIPTIGAVMHDIGGTSFDKSQNQRLTANARPSTVSQDIDVAAALFPIHSNSTRSVLTVEYRKILTNGTDSDKSKYMHGGAELNFSDMFFIRAGYNQKYWTAGLEFATEHLQIQLASYGEEVGTTTLSKEDRRYVFKAAFRF